MLLLSGVIFYSFFFKVQKLETLVADITRQTQNTSTEKLNGYDLKDYALDGFTQEEKKNILSIVSEDAWETLSLAQIDNKLKEAWYDWIADPSDPWYYVSPEDTYKAVSKTEWDTLSFQEIDKKLEKAWLPLAWDPTSPLYSLRPDEIRQKYGENGFITYIWEKQLQTLEDVRYFYDSYITLVWVVSCFILWLLWAYYFLLKAQKPLEEAIFKQKQFVSDVSHEIRTPLALMRSEAEIMLKSKHPSKESIEEWLKNILWDIDYLNELSTRLLSLATLDSEVSIEKTALNIKEVFDTIILDFSSQLKEKNIVAKNLAAKDHILMSDLWFLSQLLSILLENAMKYSDKKSSHITFKSEIKKWNIVLTLEDQWVWIDAKHLPFVFDRFYRASADRNTTGFWIGLSIAKKIVTHLSWTIHISSTLWVWTTITLVFKNEK
jgi:signal transduction histidine kinase